jgi:inner membrane protein
MDSLTHMVTGAVVAKAVGDEKIGGWGTIAGLAMGIFPDSDFVLGLFDRRFYIEYHRDFTHSILLIPFYALFFSWLLVRISKRPHFWSFYKICLPALVSHVILDLLTSYGTMIFSPFFNLRVSWDLLFIIDLVFSGIVFFPFAASYLWKRRSRWVCRGSLAGLFLYVLFCGVQHREAVDLGKAFGGGLGEEVIQVASLPQPLSPFRWVNYIETRDRVYQGFVDFKKKTDNPGAMPGTGVDAEGGNLSDRLKRLRRLYQGPRDVQYRSWTKFPDSPWVARALNTEGTRFYYWFARFPVVSTVTSSNGTHRVEFIDLRFLLPGVRMPFAYSVEFDESGGIRFEGFTQ